MLRWPPRQETLVPNIDGDGHNAGLGCGWVGPAPLGPTHPHLLGELHFDLLPDLLPLLICPLGEDVSVLQLLPAGPVPQLHRQELLLAFPWQGPWEKW